MFSILPMRKARLRGIKKFAQDYIAWVWQSQDLSLCPSHFVPALLILGYTSPFTTHYLCTIVISVPILPGHELIENRNPLLTHLVSSKHLEEPLSTAN